MVLSHFRVNDGSTVFEFPVCADCGEQHCCAVLVPVLMRDEQLGTTFHDKMWDYMECPKLIRARLDAAAAAAAARVMDSE
jgi:hypothetical protein